MKDYFIFSNEGLQVPNTSSEVREFMIARLKSIYDINDTAFEPNSPDGQKVDIFATIVYEYGQLLSKIKNSQFWSTAIGSELDKEAFYHGISRIGGQFTIQNVEIVADRVITLQGLDANYENLDATAYTVQDSTGQQFLLISTTTLNVGINTLQFRAKDYGEIITLPNTITSPIDIILGVVSVNNPNAQTTIGRDEETDEEFRLRGFLGNLTKASNSVEAMEFAIKNRVNGVVDCKVYENDTGAPSLGVDPYSTLIVVEGGNDMDIANIIYEKKGCNNQMGAVSVNVVKGDGTLKQILFDRPINQNLYIKFNIQRSRAGQNFAINSIKEYIVKNARYTINSVAEAFSLSVIASNGINQFGGGGLPLELLISKDNVSWTEYLTPDSIKHKFTLSTANISITILP